MYSILCPTYSYCMRQGGKTYVSKGWFLLWKSLEKKTKCGSFIYANVVICKRIFCFSCMISLLTLNRTHLYLNNSIHKCEGTPGTQPAGLMIELTTKFTIRIVAIDDQRTCSNSSFIRDLITRNVDLLNKCAPHNDLQMFWHLHIPYFNLVFHSINIVPIKFIKFVWSSWKRLWVMTCNDCDWCG